MCFILHMASECVLSRRTWDQSDRHVWVGDVHEHAEPVRLHFSMPNVAYIGSDINCGCGFRHLSFQGGGWPEEYLVDAGEMDTEGTQKNHQELHVVLVDALQRCAMVELYGCWAGDYAEKTEAVSEIDADAILADRFYFRERVLYRVRYPSGSTGGRSAGTTV